MAHPSVGNFVDPSGKLESVYGVKEDGAVLVPPNGHVALRCVRASGEPAHVLRETISAVSHRAC